VRIQFWLTPRFENDIKSALTTMIQKRFSDADELAVVTEFCNVKRELLQYFDESFDLEKMIFARDTLAADWWRLNTSKYPHVATYAVKAHSVPVVSSRLERFFSVMTDVQSVKRSRLDPEKASLFAGSYLSMSSNSQEKDDPRIIQSTIMSFVKALETELTNAPLMEPPSLDDVQTWVSNLEEHSAELIYADDSTTASTNDTTSDRVESVVLQEMEELMAIATNEVQNRPARTRVAPRRLNL
jgi:hypothetical protein